MHRITFPVFVGGAKVAALALMVMLVIVLVPVGVHAEAWPDLKLTYGLQPACEPLRPAILDAITAWKNWLPGSTWNETDPASAEITFVCEVPYNPPTCGGHLSLACAMTMGPVKDHETIVLSIKGLATPMGSYSVDQADRDIIAHEIGHAMGFKDGTGPHGCPGQSLMTNALGCEPPPTSPDAALWTLIPSPGESLLAILWAKYGITTETTTTSTMTTTTDTTTNTTTTTTTATTTTTTAETATTEIFIQYKQSSENVTLSRDDAVHGHS